MSNTTVTDTKAAFVAKAGNLPAPKKTAFQAHLASAPAGDWYKILAYGHSGAGKTRALIGFLKAGMKVFVANTDIGGDGMRTVKGALRAEGRGDLLDNIATFDFKDYASFNAFLSEPGIIQITATQNLWAWNPDLIAWEGMSNWQERHLGDHILLDQSPSGKASDLREAGFVADQQDWGAIRKGTLRALDRFLILHNPNGKLLHKYVTTLEDNSKADKLTGEVYKGPLIMGAARSYMAPAFDLILEMSAKGGAYKYKCGASATSLSKKRELPIANEEPGDMEALWRKITATTEPST